MPRTPDKRRLLTILGALIVLFVAIEIRSTPHWASCQRSAAEHAFMEDRIEAFIRSGAKIVPAYDDGPPAVAKDVLAYHSRMKWKYRLAAWCPWTTVPLDPPTPTLKRNAAAPK